MSDPQTELVQHLRCDLSAGRKAELTQQLVESTNEIERVSDLQKRQIAQQKEIIKREGLRQSQALHALAAGFEILPVSCRKEIDQVAKVVRVRRMDTHEIVSETPMIAERMVKT